jgi:hypothetical protein
MSRMPCWRCQTHLGVGALGVLSGALLWAQRPDQLPWVLITGGTVLAVFPVHRWARHWVTETMYTALAVAHREARPRSVSPRPRATW